MTPGRFTDPWTKLVLPTCLGSRGEWAYQGLHAPCLPFLWVFSCISSSWALTIWHHDIQTIPPHAAIRPIGTRDCKGTGEGVAGEVIAPVFIERVLDVGQALLEVAQG